MQDDIQLSLMALYFAGALVISAAGMFAIGCFIDVQRHAQRWILSMIFPIILGGMAASALLVQRDVTFADTELEVAAGVESSMLAWVLRGATGLILGLCLARLISASQQREWRAREGKSLYFALLLLFVTNLILNNLFGPNPYFDQRMLYPILIFTTLYFSRNKDRNVAIDATKTGMLLFFAGCLAAAVVLPQVALQRDYVGWIPGLGVRLWGIGPGPNSIGPLAAVFLMLLVHRPFARRPLQWLAVTVALAVLLLSQSKTAWAAAAICFPILWWGHLRHPLYPSPTPSAMRQLLPPLVVCGLGLLAVIAALLYDMYGAEIQAFTSEEDVATLTGRTYIWRIAYETWLQYPVFGYGSAMWDTAFRDLIGMEYAYHAHNQFLQTVSVSGTVGLVGLLVYVIVLFRYSLAANKPTRGLSLALFTMVIIRCITEAPFDLSGVFTGEFLMHLLLFRIVLLKGRQPMVVPARAEVPVPASLTWRQA